MLKTSNIVTDTKNCRGAMGPGPLSAD